MSVLQTLIENQTPVTEQCSNLQKARQLVQDVQKLCAKYNANFIFVTDGASGYSNGNGSHNELIKELKTKKESWERENGFNPDDDWSSNPKDTSNYKL